MSQINIISRTQRIVVDAASGAISIINAGPPGPSGTSIPKATTETVRTGTDDTEYVTSFTFQKKLPIWVPQDTTVSAISAAGSLAIAERGKLLVPAADYTVDAAWNLVSHQYALIEPGARLLMDTFPANAIMAQGATSARVDLTVDAAKGSFEVTLPSGSAATFQPNDVIGFQTDPTAAIDPASEPSIIVIPGVPGIRARELHQVIRVVGNDVHLDRALEWNYTVDHDSVFWKDTPVTDVHLEGQFTMQYASAPGEETRGIVFSRVLRSTIDTQSVDGPGIFLGDCIGVTVEAYVDGNAVHDDYRGYCFSDAGSGYDNHFKGRARHFRHGATTLPIEVASAFNPLIQSMWAGPYGTEFEITAWGGPDSYACLDTHAGAVRAKFKSCNGYGSGKASTPALQDRGYKTAIEGGEFHGGMRGVVFVINTSVGATMHGAKVSILSDSNEQAIAMAGIETTVSNTDVEALSGYGFDTGGSDHEVLGNRIRALVPLRDNTDGMLVAENWIDNEAAFFIFDSSQNTYRNNYYHRGSSATVVFLNPGVTTRLEDSWQAPVVIPWTSTITPNPPFINCLAFDVEGDTLIANPSANNKVNGARLRLMPTWDATGGWEITFGSDFDVAWLPNRASGSTETIDFVCDGTSWRQTTNRHSRQPHLSFRSGIWTPVNSGDSSFSSASSADGEGVLGSFYTGPEDVSFVDIAFEVITIVGSAGAVARPILWLDDGTDGAPGELLTDAGTVSTTTLGLKLTGASGVLPRNSHIWYAVVPQGAPTTRATLRAMFGLGHPSGVPIPIAAPVAINPTVTGIVGVPGASAPAPSGSDYWVPNIWIKPT